jgi:hypothetical protein
MESQYIGTVKNRETFVATLTYVTGYDTSYGPVTVLKFTTADGNVLVWHAKTKVTLGRSDEGKTYSVLGTVKRHEVYNGVNQTRIERCKISEFGADAQVAV